MFFLFPVSVVTVQYKNIPSIRDRNILIPFFFFLHFWHIVVREVIFASFRFSL